MRTTVRDQTGFVTFTGRFDGTTASGSGVAGTVPFVFTRTATGDYTLNFDPALMPFSVIASASANSGQATVIQSSVGAGTARIQTYSTTGTSTNSITQFTIVARKGN